jgi:hypothetical protein
VCHQNRERPIPSSDNGDKSSLKNSALNRRNILLGGTTLAAASAIVANPVQVAQAQAAPAAQKPKAASFTVGDAMEKIQTASPSEN